MGNLTVHVENPGASSAQMVSVNKRSVRTQDQYSNVVSLAPASVAHALGTWASPAPPQTLWIRSDQIGIRGLASQQVIVAVGWRSEKRCSSYLHYLCPSTHLQGLCPKACSQRFAGLVSSGPGVGPFPAASSLQVGCQWVGLTLC